MWRRIHPEFAQNCGSTVQVLLQLIRTTPGQINPSWDFYFFAEIQENRGLFTQQMNFQG